MPSDVSDRFGLVDQAAFVSGAGGGLGHAIAARLAAAGAVVACADLDGDAAARIASEIGGDSFPLALDVRDGPAYDAAVRQTHERCGRLDILCNIAGIAGNQAEVVNLDEGEVNRVIDVNLKGVLHGCQAALRVMIPHGSGSIINMASSAIDVPRAGLAPYTMAKAAVAALTKVLAVEAGPFGIRVNAVAPGWIETPLAKSSMTRPDGSVDEQALAEMMTQMRALSPLATIGAPEDVADQFLYLAAPTSRFVTGQTLRPNGGASMPW
jgi:3-oxoacyl-[acyl-carrier protein] reductase